MHTHTHNFTSCFPEWPAVLWTPGTLPQTNEEDQSSQTSQFNNIHIHITEPISHVWIEWKTEDQLNLVGLWLERSHLADTPSEQYT